MFDVERFTSFEGNTGPYILYTIVRIKSILNKYREMGLAPETGAVGAPGNETQKSLNLPAHKYKHKSYAAPAPQTHSPPPR